VFGNEEGYIGLKEDGKVGSEVVMEEENDGSCATLSTAGDRNDT